MNAYGKFEAGQQANKAGKYNLAAAKREAEALEIQAGQEVAAASMNSERIARRAREIMAENRAKAAAGGQSTLDGSVVAIERELVKNATLDQLIEIANAESRADQIRHKADTVRAQGHYDRWQGKVQQRAANLSAVGTLVQGGVSWYDKFGGGGAGGGSTSSAARGAVSGAGRGVGKALATSYRGG